MRLLTFPFRLLFSLIGLIGRFATAVMGMVLICVGVVVSLTIVGAIVGVPIAIVGGLLVMRSIF